MNHLTCKHILADNVRLRAENERLRGKLKLADGRHTKRIRRAYVSALALASLHIAYLPTTRKQAMLAGLSQRQFENGRAMLQMARVLNGRKWKLHNLADIDDRLNAAVARALADPEVFRSRLPRHATR